MSGVARFEPYAAPMTSVAVAVREIDETTAEVVALRRDNQRLRREAANALAAAEAERVESARLRAQNRELTKQLEWENSR